MTAKRWQSEQSCESFGYCGISFPFWIFKRLGTLQKTIAFRTLPYLLGQRQDATLARFEKHSWVQEFHWSLWYPYAPICVLPYRQWSLRYRSPLSCQFQRFSRISGEISISKMVFESSFQPRLTRTPLRHYFPFSFFWQLIQIRLMFWRNLRATSLLICECFPSQSHASQRHSSANFWPKVTHGKSSSILCRCWGR